MYLEAGLGIAGATEEVGLAAENDAMDFVLVAIVAADQQIRVFARLPDTLFQSVG